MPTVTIEVADRDTTVRRVKAEWPGKRQVAFITFPTHEALWTTLTAERWSILKALTGGRTRGFE